MQDRDRRIAVPVVDGTEWKVHPDNPRYLISRDGKIYSLKHKKILNAETTKAGYKRVSLWYRDLGKGKVFCKHDNDTEIKKVPIIKPIKIGREKHEFGKRSWG